MVAVRLKVLEMTNDRNSSGRGSVHVNSLARFQNQKGYHYVVVGVQSGNGNGMRGAKKRKAEVNGKHGKNWMAKVY